MIINGLALLVGLIIVIGLFFILSKVSVLKTERDMWKESTYAVTEMYNNLLLENKIEAEIHNIGKNNLPLPKRSIN